MWGVPFHPLKDQLLPGDLRIAQNLGGFDVDGCAELFMSG